MSNAFQFKQFKIEQDNAPFKVGTDGVLLGAWTCKKNPRLILDVGTGTGLIAIMMAQRFQDASIQAIEMDKTAFENALNNVKNSQFNERISLFNTKLQNFVPIKAYDMIVCNPPFFSNSFKSGNSSKDASRHNDHLSLSELFQFAKNHLKENGNLSLILPYEQQLYLLKVATDNDFHLSWKCVVYPTPTSKAKRILVEFRKYEREIREDSLVIEDGGRHQYSETYKGLTKEFYLD